MDGSSCFDNLLCVVTRSRHANSKKTQSFPPQGWELNENQGPKTMKVEASLSSSGVQKMLRPRPVRHFGSFRSNSESTERENSSRRW